MEGLVAIEKGRKAGGSSSSSSSSAEDRVVAGLLVEKRGRRGKTRLRDKGIGSSEEDEEEEEGLDGSTSGEEGSGSGSK